VPDKQRDWCRTRRRWRRRSRAGPWRREGAGARAGGGVQSRLLYADGEGRRRVLRMRPRWMTEKRMAFEHGLAAHLADRGVRSQAGAVRRAGDVVQGRGCLLRGLSFVEDGMANRRTVTPTCRARYSGTSTARVASSIEICMRRPRCRISSLRGAGTPPRSAAPVRRGRTLRSH